MQASDNRAEHLGWVETALRRAHPDLATLRIIAQSHYGPPDRIAFIEVHGVSKDRDRRRHIRAEAGDLVAAAGLPGRA